MDKRYSAITDLYGQAAEEKPPKRSSNIGLYVVLALIGFFVFESLESVMRLRSDPPQYVVGARVNKGDSQYESQLRTARACWNYAIESVQDKYPFGSSLPDNVPPILRGSNGKASELSVLCWPRLRGAWPRPESWVEKYEWRTDWISDPDSSFRQTLHKILNIMGINY